MEARFDFDQWVKADSSTCYSGSYAYERGRYQLAYQLVPQRSGLYCLAHRSAYLAFNSNQDFDGRCPTLETTIAVKLNDGQDNNIHLLHDGADRHWRDSLLLEPQARFHDAGGYCFYVIP
ncbi:MAG: hypothetical protein AAFW73_25015 [Bacteroidota bacterium]